MGKSSPLLNEFLASITPKKPFSAESIPGVPDYSNDESWAALPGKKSVALLHPPEEKNNNNRDVDCFFVHPTGFFFERLEF